LLALENLKNWYIKFSIK